MFRPFKRFNSKRDKKHESASTSIPASSSSQQYSNSKVPLPVADSGGMVMLNGKGSSKSCTTLPLRQNVGSTFTISDPVVIHPKCGTLPVKNGGLDEVKMRNKSSQKQDSSYKRRSWFHLSGSSKSLGNYNIFSSIVGVYS